MDTVEQLMNAEDLHPIDIVEALAERQDWDFDRVGENQIAMAIEGQWRTYSVTLAFSYGEEMLRLICTFDLDPPEARLPELYEALDRANDLCWSGGFSLWRERKLMVWKYGLTLAGGAVALPGQIDDILAAAVEACERFYPAFQLVCWGDEAPADAMGIAMAEAYGRA
ncbi:MAG: YbjN domain-containing protein [Pseudomonadota bacterium]